MIQVTTKEHRAAGTTAETVPSDGQDPALGFHLNDGFRVSIVDRVMIVSCEDEDGTIIEVNLDAAAAEALLHWLASRFEAIPSLDNSLFLARRSRLWDLVISARPLSPDVSVFACPPLRMTSLDSHQFSQFVDALVSVAGPDRRIF